VAIVACRECGKDISTEARICPHCGAPTVDRDKALISPRLFTGILVVGAICVFGFFLSRSPFQGTASIPKCDEASTIDTIKGAAAGSAANKLIGFKIFEVKEIKETSWSEVQQIRQCVGQAYSSTGAVPISFSIKWMDRKQGQIYVEYVPIT
jgi:hypothetical protein